jgi:flagellar FliL protein
MSAAAAQTADAVVVPPAKGKKKLIVIVAAVLLLLVSAGAGAAYYLRMKAAAAAAAAELADEDGAAAHAEARAGKPDAAHVPTFLPLEPFVVNLADKDADRYAQIGITLEIDDPKFADQLKAYMPAIRNGILMVLAHKSSAELLERSGKVALAGEIMREAVRPLGIELDDPAPEPAKAGGDSDGEDKAKRKPKRKLPAAHNPLRHVHFSNFIIQ